MKLLTLLIALIIIVGLLVMNIYLVNKVSQAEDDVTLYKMRFEALQGDVDVLTYDLITSRDSVRILNNERERISE